MYGRRIAASGNDRRDHRAPEPIATGAAQRADGSGIHISPRRRHGVWPRRESGLGSARRCTRGARGWFLCDLRVRPRSDDGRPRRTSDWRESRRPARPYFGVAELLRERAQRAQVELETHAALTAEGLRDGIAGTALLWIESPTNPMLDVVDLSAVIAVAKRAGALVLVDNTFATPLGQSPLKLGADLVLHSATKLIGGHSDLLLGAVVGADPSFDRRLRNRRSMTGATPGALEAYLALRGLRTLPVRLGRAQATAGELASRLADHPGVGLVRYPGAGTMISFETMGSGEQAEAVCEATRLIVHATSLGGVETTMERRARYASERAVGTPETLIRLSVGLEHLDDLWRDLDHALAASIK